MRYKYYMVVFLLWKSACLYGQKTVPAGTEVQELVKISEVYANIPNLSFNLKYTYADTLTWQTFTDSMFASCKLSYGKSLVSNSELEYLKGTDYNVFVDKEDSIVMVSRRLAEESLFQAPLLDSGFRETNVLSMNIIEYSDSLWSFNVTFKPDSYYSFYEMFYNPQSGLVSSVNYHGRNDAGAHDIPSDHVICANVIMTNYSDAELDPVLFNENRYFYRLNGVTYLQPAWQQFHLENY
jgi:hypothetical protein